MSSESNTTEKTIIEVPPSNRRGASNTDESDAEARFSQSKKEWAASLDDEASAYICKHFGVPEKNVYDLEGLFEDEYDPDSPKRALHLIDYSGIDKLVDLGERIVPVAYRFRPDSDDGNGYDVDFSYCVDNGTNKHAEKTKHLTAYREGGLYPTLYAFGITDPEKTTLKEFHLIEMDAFLGCIEVGALSPSGPHERTGGVWALYYSVENLQTSGCILESWVVGDER